MSQRFACPRGHVWEAGPTESAGEATMVCPECGVAGSASSAAEFGDEVTVRPVDDLPPPPQGRAGEGADKPAVPGYEILEELGRGGMGVVKPITDTAGSDPRCSAGADRTLTTSPACSRRSLRLSLSRRP